MQSIAEIMSGTKKIERLRHKSSEELPPIIKGERENWNTILIGILGIKPVAFNPLLAKISGSATSGLFMSQLLYWWEKGHDKELIYKTIEEIRNETGLSRSEQDIAIRKWVGLGVLEKCLRGIPPKRHFRIDTGKLVNLLKTAKRFVEN